MISAAGIKEILAVMEHDPKMLAGNKGGRSAFVLISTKESHLEALLVDESVLSLNIYY